MDPGLRSFLKMYLFVVAVFAVLGGILAMLLRQDLISILAQVFFWVGIGYMAAATFAWTGFANLYRYSPTLLFGSPSYRRQIVKGNIWKEGRDNGSFITGLCFGLALLGLSVAFIDPVLILVDVLGVALALIVRHILQMSVAVRS